ncbi:hypothetical protein AFLA70_146g002880 [Aspergillus flavus AF70]|nr:hypothetical protein AFLA70_146g002880 [Aspergillus flavus AF70]
MGTFEAKGNWDDIGKALRLHILCWKYYYFDEIKETLVKQGLAAEWKDWVRSEYQRAETQVKTFLLEWAQKSYDPNRPDDPNVSLQPGQARQKDHKIVRMFETYLDAVHNLQPWNSDWDMQIDDGDGMDTGSDGGGSDDGDGMDID